MNDTEKKALILFILFLILSFIDILTKYKKCVKDQPKIIPEIFLHRAISVFFYFGWIFNNKVILIFYLIGAFIILIHWFTNKFECVLTQYENKICNFRDDTRYDYIFRIFNYKTSVIITIILEILILFIIFYKLFYSS